MREWSTLSINNNPSNPQQPVHSLRIARTSKYSTLRPSNMAGKSIHSMGDLQDPIELWGYSLKFRPYIYIHYYLYGIGTSNLGSWVMAIDPFFRWFSHKKHRHFSMGFPHVPRLTPKGSSFCLNSSWQLFGGAVGSRIRNGGPNFGWSLGWSII